MGNASDRYELWLYFGDWTGEGMGSAEQVARDYVVEFDRREGEARVVVLHAGASESDAEYEGWEIVRMGGVERVEVRLGGEVVGTWTQSGEPDEDGFARYGCPTFERGQRTCVAETRHASREAAHGETAQGRAISSPLRWRQGRSHATPSVAPTSFSVGINGSMRVLAIPDRYVFSRGPLCNWQSLSTARSTSGWIAVGICV
jgi:hypothetical protein